MTSMLQLFVGLSRVCCRKCSPGVETIQFSVICSLRIYRGIPALRKRSQRFDSLPHLLCYMPRYVLHQFRSEAGRVRNDAAYGHILQGSAPRAGRSKPSDTFRASFRLPYPISGHWSCSTRHFGVDLPRIGVKLPLRASIRSRRAVLERRANFE